jgi:5-methylcytosine-specific restriction protein B
MRQLGGKATVDQLVAHPLLVAKYAAKPFGVSLRTRIWSSLGQHASDSSSVVKTKRRVGERVFDKTPDGTWFLAEDLPDEVEDRAKATGRGGSQVSQRDYAFVTFHQAYSYEDFVEGIRPVLSGDDDDEASALGYQLRDGVFLKAARAALGLTDFRGSLEEFCELTQPERRRHLDGAPRYALFIDEINRGNVARVLGELITLLEVDKRLGEEHELIVTLPYSQRPFGVPSNLHVIGTMNTADRSVEALDAALRRRFEFRELAPQPDLLRPDVDGVDVQRLLRTINLRLEVLAGRDHAIGHAYFLEALEDDPTIENLKQIFEVKLVPLLQEYFFGDWGKIGLVLGKEFVSRRDHSQVELADFDHPDRETLADRATWELRPMASITNRSFQRIYDPNVAD